MDNVSTAGSDRDIEQTTALIQVIGRMRVFVACENIKLFNRQIASTGDEADRRLLTRMLWEEEENLEAARASLRD